MVRFKHRYLVATVAASPGQTADLGVKDIMAMLKVRAHARVCVCSVLFGNLSKFAEHSGVRTNT